MRKKRYDNCEGECLPYQSLADDAVEMAKTLRDIEYACRDIIQALPAVMEKYKINALKEIIGGCKHG